MRQLLLIFWSLFLAAQATSQENAVYTLQENTSTSIVVDNQVDGITIDLSLGSFSENTVLVDGNPFSQILVEDGISIMEKGLPDIQYISASIAIPFTGKTAFEIRSGDYVEFPNFNIAPSAGDPGIYTDRTQPLTFNNDIYSTNSFFPANIVLSNDPYIFGGSRGQAFHFYPIQYNPVTKVLRVYTRISINIQTINEAGINELTVFSPVISSIFNSISSAHYDNTLQENTLRYTALEEKGNMLVISHPDFMESMKPFVEWKNQKGINCEIVDVTAIGSLEQIRKYVSDYYYTKGLTYLLLVGDAEFVPTNQAARGASDNMYGYIAGDDHYPEILVGRFSCQTAQECDLMVKRTVNYEKNPAASDSYSNFLGIGSDEGPGDDGELDFQHLRNITDKIGGNPFRGITELFDGSQGGNDRDGNPTDDMVSEVINNGTGAIMYIGHGSQNSWVTSGFNVTDAKNLINKEVQPFVWAAGCDNGNFNGSSCLAEFMIRAEEAGQPTGVLATLMSSATQTWYPPMEAQDEIGRILSIQKTHNNALSFGGLSLSGCMKMNDKYGFGAYKVTDTWILFGDPSVEIRTDKPVKVEPVHETIIGYDAASLTIENIQPGVYIAVSAEGKLLSVVCSEGNAAVLILPSLKGLDKVLITVTGRNLIPYIGEIQVTNEPSVAINPNPGNHNNKVPTSTAFNWSLSTGVTPDSYTFCIRETGSTTWDLYSIKSASELALKELEYLTAYDWKVISHTADAVTESRIFSFTTIEQPDEDFEQSGFPRNNWVNGHDWYVDNSEAYEGSFSLHSGSTESREFSSLFYECETVTCDYISFQIKLNAIEEGAGLIFLMDDFQVASWTYTMGWANITYQVEPGNHVFEWRFTAGNQSGSQSAAWLDNIYLPTNEAVVFEKTSQENCPVGSIQLEAMIANHASLSWKTNGTGYFDDPTRIDAIYYPSEDDLLNENISLELEVTANSTCAAQLYPYDIQLAELPEITGANDTTLYLNESFTVPGNNDFASMYILYNNDTIPSSPVLDPDKLSKGENIITVVAESDFGCRTTKEFRINVIGSVRPQNSSLTVYPNPTADFISIYNPDSSGPSIISIYTTDGMMIEQHLFEGNESNRIQVNHLNNGLYIVRSESDGKSVTGKFLKM